jgi:DNA invertase Pin-like site-specific DNA recombinase
MEQVRVFAYLRVSTKEQLDGGGLERQSESIKKFVEQKGWLVVRAFQDQQSGGDEFADRAGLTEILELACPGAAHGVQAIVVERADRIARDLMVQEIFLRECRKRNLQVYAADSGEELVLAGADPTRVLIRQILGALAQWEKSQIVLKLQAGRRKKARETGEPCGGIRPYGQTASELAVIDQIFSSRKAGFSFREIAKILNDIGFPTPTGMLFWGSGSVHRIWNQNKGKRS